MKVEKNNCQTGSLLFLVFVLFVSFFLSFLLINYDSHHNQLREGLKMKDFKKIQNKIKKETNSLTLSLFSLALFLIFFFPIISLTISFVSFIVNFFLMYVVTIF